MGLGSKMGLISPVRTTASQTMNRINGPTKGSMRSRNGVRGAAASREAGGAQAVDGESEAAGFSMSYPL